MSKILKSNKIAINPLIDFKYSTMYGGANKETYDLLIANINDGFTMSETSFLAIDNFVTNLKNNDIWGKMTEIALLYGNSYSTLTRKLKYTLGSSPQNMIATAGDSISLYEELNGIYIGRNSYTRLATPDPALNMGFMASDLGDSWGASFYTDTSTINSERSVINTLCGAKFETKSISMRILDNTLGEYKTTSAFASSEAGGVFNADTKGLIRYTGQKTSATTSTLKTYFNDSLLLSVNINFFESDDRDRDIWVFAENPYNNGNYYGYSGKVRFIAFDDNTLSTIDSEYLYSQVETLMTALGKNFN